MLYPILHALENEQLIEAYWEETELVRKRKYDHITNKGKKELEQKKKEWQTYADGVKKVLSPSTPGIA